MPSWNTGILIWMLNCCRGLHLPAKLLLTHSILRQSRMRTWPQHSLTLTTGAALASWWRGVETGECSGNLCKIILNYFIFITISYLREVSQPLWPDPAISAAMTSALSSLLRSPPTGDEPGNMIVSVPGVNNIVLRSGVSKYSGHRTNIWRLLYKKKLFLPSKLYIKVLNVEYLNPIFIILGWCHFSPDRREECRSPGSQLTEIWSTTSLSRSWRMQSWAADSSSSAASSPWSWPPSPSPSDTWCDWSRLSEDDTHWRVWRTILGIIYFRFQLILWRQVPWAFLILNFAGICNDRKSIIVHFIDNSDHFPKFSFRWQTMTWIMFLLKIIENKQWRTT